MDVKAQTEKVEIPWQVRRDLSDLNQLEMDIHELRTIQTSLGHGMFGDEKDIRHLHFIASQIALESIERVCRDTAKWLKGRYTEKTSSEDIPF
jgi:hypothetical protein